MAERMLPVEQEPCCECPQGFFVPYLTGAIVLVVLAVGSTAPGLLQVAFHHNLHRFSFRGQGVAVCYCLTAKLMTVH